MNGVGYVEVPIPRSILHLLTLSDVRVYNQRTMKVRIGAV